MSHVCWQCDISLFSVTCLDGSETPALNQRSNDMNLLEAPTLKVNVPLLCRMK